MKKAIYTFLFVIGVIGCTIWFILESLEREQAILDRVPKAPMPERVEASPYPAGLWKELGGYGNLIRISNHSEGALPRDIPWQNGTDTPVLGDCSAVKGGALRQSNVGPFPSNFLAFGSPSPQFFHYSLFDMIDMPLVQRHPESDGPLPGVADAWAVIGNTVWFRINPRARYSNGKPVRAGDYALGMLLRSKCKHGADWQRLTEAAGSVRFYGKSVIAITLRHSCPRALYLAASLLQPAEPGFYAEFGNDYTERYAQRIPPTTGAYTIAKVETGRLIRLEKVPDWWAADLPHRRYTCNVDAIEHHFLTDEAQAWELFLRGKLDVMQTRNISAWQEKLRDVPAVEEGRIVTRRFKVEHPLPPYGIAVNTKTVPHITMRRAIMHALDMGKAIDILFRGEGEQLENFTSGYGTLSPRSIPQYEYLPGLARKYFAMAGFTEQGEDGILRREDGTRLSFKLTYTPSAKTETLFSVLAQGAKACGMELVSDPEPWQNVDKMTREGTHELLFWAAVPSSLMPQPERFLHSTAAGPDAPFNLDLPEMDEALARCYKATTLSALASACVEVDELVYKLAIWLPGWKEDMVRIAMWNHVHLPDHYYGPYDVMEGHTFWIQDPATSVDLDSLPEF